MYPTLLHLGNLYLPTFGVLAAAGLLCGLLLSERTAKLAGIDPTKLWNAGLVAVIAAYVSSRVLLVVDHWRSFVQFPVLLLAVPSLTAAGLLVTVAAIFLWLWLKQIPPRSALDAWAPCATLVWAFLALGHLAEGSDPGMISPHGSTHPVALYAAALAAVITIAAWRWLHRSRGSGETAAFVLLCSGAGQFLLSFLRVPGVAFLWGLDQLQCAALCMIVAGCALILTPRPRNPQASY